MDRRVNDRGGLARGDEPIVLEHVEGKRPGLMRMEDYTRTADAMDRRVNALRRELDHSVALQRPSRFVEHDQVARACLGPVQDEGQDKVSVVMAGDRQGEGIVDSLSQLVA